MNKKQCTVNRRDFLRKVLSTTVVGSIAFSSLARAAGRDKPNIVILLADDMTWTDCEPYGSPDVRTPNMTRLAREGMKFNQCNTTSAMCSPTRQQLHTGVYPVRNGGYPNHSKVYDGTRSMVHYFHELGYRVGHIGKTMVKPPDSFPWEELPNGDGHGDEFSYDQINGFIDRDPNQPYVLVISSHQPHGGYSYGPRYLYNPEDIEVPPYLIDTPKTREKLADYYAEITKLDSQLGNIMDVVDSSADPENTITIFTTEQGSSFPFGGKWTCYETGLHVGFIARWPRKIAPGSETDAMVGYVDVLPTLLEAAGTDPTTIDTGLSGAPDGGREFDGSSFLPILTGKADNPDVFREFQFGVQTMRGINNWVDYPIRSVRSDRYKLIRNLNHEQPAICGYYNDIRQLGWDKAAEEDEEIAARVEKLTIRPPEELYDLKEDPFELNNLADRPEYADIKAYLGRQLDAWMEQQGDTGMGTEQSAQDHFHSGWKKKWKEKKYEK